MGFEVDQSGRSFYEPSAFYLFLRSDILDDRGNLRCNELPILMHEYAHLIQDTTTIYGVVEFLHFIDTVQDVVRALRALPSPVPLPISARPECSDLWLTTLDQIRQLQAYSRWDGSAVWAHQSHQVRSQQFTYKGESGTTQWVDVDFIDNVSGRTYTHSIGPKEIKEAYSKAVEAVHSPGSSPANIDPTQFHYYAVERIVPSFYPNSDPRHRVVICHWALQDLSPGVRLFEILQALAQETFTGDAEDLHAFCRQLAVQTRNLTGQVQGIRERIQQARDTQCKGAPDDFYCQVLSWYHDRVLPRLALSVDGARSFPLDTFLCAPTAATFESFIDVYPVPMVEVEDGKIWSWGHGLLDHESVFFLRSMANLIRNMWHGDKTTWDCPWRTSCDRGHIKYRNDQCLSQPWTKSLLRPTCPYGAAAAYLDNTGTGLAFTTEPN